MTVVTDLLVLQMQCPCSGGRSRPLLWLILVGGTWLAIRLGLWTFKKEGGHSMHKSKKIAIIAALIVAIGTVMALKQQRNGETPVPTAAIAATAAVESAAALPRLVELGADKCIPCKMMAPILEELRNEYPGQLQVDFFDVWKNPGIAQEYGIQSIPTQIFYDAQGNELFRHPGYFAKEDILAKWKELGVELAPKP